ncbi:Jumonji and AT-rich interaction domain containing 2 [Homalodisca vitripennis]|nr:Jumonji and AT-rich interaction domain containing 2 [Homalodisca vitripennis]
MRESSEPTMFSLEKLLFSIVNDSRSSIEVLNQILPIVVSLRDGEVAGRTQLEELGLTASERLNTNKRRTKSRAAAENEEDYECEKCRTNLFISFRCTKEGYFLPTSGLCATGF